MAKIEFKGIDKYVSLMKSLEADTEAICKAAVYDGAGILADAIRAEYSHISHPYGGADLMEHLVITSIRNDKGFVNTKITIGGYLQSGKPAPLVARVMESGNSHQGKKPFVRPAVSRVKKQCEAAMEKKVDKILRDIVKKNGG